MPRTSRSAFTLIELLVVIAIIGMLAVVVILTLNPVELFRQARDSNRLSDLATLTTCRSPKLYPARKRDNSDLICAREARSLPVFLEGLRSETTQLDSRGQMGREAAHPLNEKCNVLLYAARSYRWCSPPSLGREITAPRLLDRTLSSGVCLFRPRWVRSSW
jgi:prepilin-type N-terminal cleavage/methylation domain-containing protein